MISRSNSGGGTGSATDGRGYERIRGGAGSGGDQYTNNMHMYQHHHHHPASRSTSAGGGIGIGSGGVGGSFVGSGESSIQRRNHFQRSQQQHQLDRRLTDAPSDGVIRSASLQHHPLSSSMSSSNFMASVATAAAAVPGGVTTTSSASAIGTNHIHHPLSLNRSSSSGCQPTSKTTAGNIRHLKKTVRFDADEDDPVQSQPVNTTTNSPAALAANGLAQSSDNKTWDWLMKGHNRQESRDSAARDSGVETLTSGEDVIVLPHNATTTNSTHHHHHHHHPKHPYDHRAKVNSPSKWTIIRLKESQRLRPFLTVPGLVPTAGQSIKKREKQNRNVCVCVTIDTGCIPSDHEDSCEMGSKVPTTTSSPLRSNTPLLPDEFGNQPDTHTKNK